jgi:hypothetical protein
MCFLLMNPDLSIIRKNDAFSLDSCPSIPSLSGALSHIGYLVPHIVSLVSPYYIYMVSAFM